MIWGSISLVTVHRALWDIIPFKVSLRLAALKAQFERLKLQKVYSAHRGCSAAVGDQVLQLQGLGLRTSMSGLGF